MYSEVYIKTVFGITEMSRDKLFHAEMLTQASILSKCTLLVLPFRTVDVLRWE